MSNVKVDSYVSMYDDGIHHGAYVGDSDEPVVDSVTSWSEILENLVEMECVPDGPIVVDDGNDGVYNLLAMADKLRSVADDLEDMVRSKKVLVRPLLGEGVKYEDAILSYQQFMRGYYP